MKHLILLAALPCALLAQSIEGTWQGTIPNPNNEIRLAFTIAKSGDAYQGTFFNLANGRQFNLGAITLQGTALKIAIPGNGMTYDGKLEADGNSIAGGLTQQNGNAQPLPLKRATPQTAWDLPKQANTPPPAGVPPGTKLEFEVATIKPSGEAAQGPGFNESGNVLRARSVSLANLFVFAWDIHPSQVTGFPDWAQTEGYEIAASSPLFASATEAQLKTMLQNLVKSRFNLTLHSEKRELPAYAITIGKNGPVGLKLVKNTSNGPRFNAQGLGSIVFSGVTIADFAGQMQQRVLDRPVVDQTGLTDRWDFTLNWRPDEFQFPALLPVQRDYWIAQNAGKPDLFAAVQEQLGLKLESTKVPMDIFVIDSASRPSEN